MGMQNYFFSGMFHEVTIGGQTFATERAKKDYETREWLHPTKSGRESAGSY